MLRARILTALVLAPLIVSAIYLLPLGWYAAFFWLVAAAGAWEWAGLARLERPLVRIGYVAALTVLVVLTWRAPEAWRLVLWLGALFWVGASLLVLAYPGSGRLLDARWAAGVAGLLVTWSAWAALVVIRDHDGGATWLLFLLLLVWSADIGAYFAGRRYGRRKLAPSVSPAKTWEGALGGALFSMVTGLVMLALMGASSAWWAAMIVLLVIVSVFGDLFESVLKRHRGVKDSGALLPGHGGVLDRIDSAVAVLPVFALMLSVSGS